MAGHTSPPALESAKPRIDKHTRLLIALSLAVAILITIPFVLRVFGLVRPFLVPTAGMAPAIAPGDHVLMEGLTYLGREPKRGEIIVFATENTPGLPSGTLYVKRVAALPGERVRIEEGQLIINGQALALSNALGQIRYTVPKPNPLSINSDFLVAADSFFVLGDNTVNSLDSRYWGSVPRRNIKGLITFCYWPPSRAGNVY